MVNLVAVGDMAFTGPLAKDPAAVAERIRPELLAVLRSGVLLANLECVLYDDVAPGQKGLGNSPMHSPTRTVDALKHLGVQVVSLANNHIRDFGRDAVRSTLRALDEAGIVHFGAGLDFDQASRPAFLDRDGLRLGFVGFGSSQYPGKDREGTIPLEDRQARKIVARAAGDCDFLVVCIHDGIEAFDYPMRSTVKAARAFARAGAGLVVGSHPHCIQGVERRDGTDIFYSVGNFLIPMFSPEPFERWRVQTALTLMGFEITMRQLAEAIVLEARIEGPGRCQVAPRPVLLDEEGVPHLATGEDERTILARLAELSAKFGDPSAAQWRRRDETERKFLRMAANSVSWLHVLKNIKRLRPRHIKAYLKGRFG